MSSEAGPDTGARPDRALLRLIHQLLVVRTSGKLADHQRGYPRWELANAELRSLLEAGVGGVILLGGSAAELALRCEALPEVEIISDTALQQVVANLLDNAAKAMPKLPDNPLMPMVRPGVGEFCTKSGMPTGW